MTSNLGSDELQAFLQAQPDAPDSALHELLRPILREHFQPALLARFQTLIYRPLQADALKRIVVLKLAQVAKRLLRHYGVNCQIDDHLGDALVAACLLPDTGARNIDSLLNQQILPVLSQQLLQRQAAQLNTQGVTLGYSAAEGITLHFTDAAKEA
jgi:type VI secretion system protein VasG